MDVLSELRYKTNGRGTHTHARTQIAQTLLQQLDLYAINVVCILNRVLIVVLKMLLCFCASSVLILLTSRDLKDLG